MWPRAFNGEIGGKPGQTYLIVGDIGTPSGQGLDFINGFTFLCGHVLPPSLLINELNDCYA